MVSRAGIDFSAAWFDWFVRTRPTPNAYLKAGPNGTLTWTAASPSAGAFTNPDYIFYRDGTTYNALNGRTGTVDYTEDTATNADACSDCLQAAINNTITTYGHGAIYFMPGATYVFTIEVAHASGNIFLYSHGAVLDVSGMNTDVFDFGDDAVFRTGASACLTGMSGFTIVGAVANTSTKLITIRNICNFALVEKLSFKEVANLVEIRGGCYSAVVRDVAGGYMTGIGVRVVGTATGGSANDVLIDHVQISNADNVAYATAIGVKFESVTTLDTARVERCWFERMNTGVLTAGAYVRVRDCHIAVYQGVAPKGVDLGTGTSFCDIVNNYFYVPDGGFGVYASAGGIRFRVKDNFFVGIYGTCISNGATACYADIEGNTATFTAAGAQQCFLDGIFQYSRINNNSMESSTATLMTFDSSTSYNVISGNHLHGDVASTVWVTGAGSYNQVTGNYIMECAKGWDDTGFTYTNIVGNLFAGCTADIDDLDATSVSEHNMT